MIIFSLNKNKRGMNKLVKKTIIFDEETATKIEQLARENQRDFSKQIRFIIDEYLKLIQKK